MSLPNVSEIASYGNLPISDDPSKNFETRKKAVQGSLALLAISAIAYSIFRYAPVQTVFWYSAGLASTAIAKYISPEYTFLQTIERKIFLLEKKAPYVHVIVNIAAIIFSFFLPLVAYSAAFVSGCTAGLFLHTKFLSFKEQPVGFEPS